MQPGIDHQPHRAQLLVLQRTVTVPWIVEEAHLIAQRLRIERPAFDIGRVAAEAHECRKIGVFLREADLEMMPRCAFVQVERHIARRQPAGQVIGVEIECPRPRTVRRARIVRTTRFELLAILLVGLDLERGLRDQREIFADLLIDLFADIVIALRQRLAALRLELLVGAHVVEELVERPLEADFLLDLLEAILDPRHFGQA